MLSEESTLLVNGDKHPEPQDTQVLHRGIASRAFKQSFNLADHVKVTGANLVNGMLTIELTREVPEASPDRDRSWWQKPRDCAGQPVTRDEGGLAAPSSELRRN